MVACWKLGQQIIFRIDVSNPSSINSPRRTLGHHVTSCSLLDPRFALINLFLNEEWEFHEQQSQYFRDQSDRSSVSLELPGMYSPPRFKQKDFAALQVPGSTVASFLVLTSFRVYQYCHHLLTFIITVASKKGLHSRSNTQISLPSPLIAFNFSSSSLMSSPRFWCTKKRSARTTVWIKN